MFENTLTPIIASDMLPGSAEEEVKNLSAEIEKVKEGQNCALDLSDSIKLRRSSGRY